MISRDAIETTYAFFHQKLRVYEHSTMDWQKDDIEQAISSYAEEMNPELLGQLSGGKADFLNDHRHFAEDLRASAEQLEQML